MGITWKDIDIPCGCEERKHIMFEQGAAGRLDVAILLGVPLGILIFLWLSKRG